MLRYVMMFSAATPEPDLQHITIAVDYTVTLYAHRNRPWP